MNQRVIPSHTHGSGPPLARRGLLRLALGAGIGAVTAVRGTGAAAAPIPAPATQRWLRLHNTVTGERFDDLYWDGGRPVPDALASIDWLLRDHHCDRCARMDVDLLHRLSDLQARLPAHGPIEVLSGYRTAETNRRLVASGIGASPRSLHMEARAVDIRAPGVPARTLYRAALASGPGGVGGYLRRRFVHLDTGPERRWLGR
ncbi:DUF882 domain-containing protein [Azospirillum sp. RWY-5-1]|uniref:Murein endopeptidase K n=1 Tax=Azospirillum oleiclasticum TaxID=2735135 RepID=A0ABX2THA6_9PROT|nr:DUF882 domain-containing protein [Azospirillum oleiclasticum]NYZ16245.1 DUF882 domain-containing protein [Azospirillum oleiclasticum]NYZ23732.1 DUF882 domain-containing protein [Azospirillum oleiclasticum]